MIIVKSDRSVYIPEADRHIGFQNDHLVESRLFQITDSELFDFSFKLDIKNTLDIVDLAPYVSTGDSLVLRWDISAPVIGKGGVITAQLRAFDKDGERVWHSAVFEFIAESSVNAEKEANNERTITAFEQLEARVQTAVEGIEDSALQSKQYAESASESSAAAQAASESASQSKADAQTAKESVIATADSLNKLEQDFKEMTGGYEAIFAEAQSHYENKENPHNVTAQQVGAYTTEQIQSMLAQKAEKDHSHTVTAQQTGAYTIQEVDNLLSGKADTGHTHEITASDVGAYTAEQTDKLLESKAEAEHSHETAEYIYSMADVDLKQCTEVSDLWDDSDAVVGNNCLTGGSTCKFTIDVSGYVELSASANGGGASLNINGKEYSVPENSEFEYKGEITSPIIAKTSSATDTSSDTITFSRFSAKSAEIAGSTSGMMPENSLKMLYDLNEKTGDIDTALDSILAMQENLIGGETA